MGEIIEELPVLSCNGNYIGIGVTLANLTVFRPNRFRAIGVWCKEVGSDLKVQVGVVCPGM